MSKVAAFRALHQSGCFVMPNPWDEGSARLLEQTGFRALATTSSGFAWSKAKPDNGVPLESVLAHLRVHVDGRRRANQRRFRRGIRDDA